MAAVRAAAAAERGRILKIITQVGIIFGVCWAAQIVEQALPFAFPASVIGMILMFLLLAFRVLKVDHIREKSDFLLGNMAFFFIPAGVSIINYFDVLKDWVFQLIFYLYRDDGDHLCGNGVQHEICDVSDGALF